MRAFLGSHKKLIGIVVIVLVILLAIFWPKPPPDLPTQKAQKETITQAVATTGSIVADSAVDLTFIAGGKLVYLGVKEGDTVKVGQTIAVLDQRSFQKNLESSLLAYSVERNEFEQGRYDNNAPTPNDAITQDIKFLLETNQFNLNSSVVQVELQAIAKEASVLTSPINGIVTETDVTTTGINITPSTTFSIADPTSLVFQIEVDEADVGNIQIGDTVDVTLDAYPNNPLKMSVESIDFDSQTSDTGGTIFNVEATLPQMPGVDYRIGMNGDANIITAESSNTLVVSLASLTDDNSVYIKKGDTFEKRKVEAGIQSDTDVQILSGLEEGDEVALQPDDAAELVKNSNKRFFFF
ncbi:MAG: efflux RND transporter periplasmic adaptor subunit [Patescibacteria group bacterium]